MQCAECLSHNESDATFCTQCGAKIGVYPSRGPKVLTLFALLFLATAVGGGSVAFVMSQRDRAERRTSDPVTTAPEPRFNEPSGNGKEAEGETAPSDLENGRSLRLAVRRISFVGHGERRIASTEVVVSGDGWVPVPRRLALAATDWVVTGRSSGRSEIGEGIWRRGEKLGLWRTGGEDGQGARLGSYDPEAPLELHPLDGGEVVTISTPRAFRDGSFLFFSSDQPPGALVQAQTLVGWILEDPSVVGGWLWPGETGEEIEAELSVDDFYAITFAGGREEGFAEALTIDDSRARAKAIIDAQRKRPKLLVDETPEHLLPASMVPVLVRDLIAVRDRGEPQRVAELLAASTIADFRDPDLLLLAVDTWDDAYGEQPAIALAQQWWPDLIEPGSVDESELSGLVVAYYGRWLQRLITDRAIDSAWRIFQEAQGNYPEDADIHLRGVELFLFDNNWADAEQSLESRGYPARFGDRVALLRRQIQELKSLEGKIVVRFPPGARQVTTQVVINGTVRQDYIIDTGASVTTLPSATARQLGIRITDSTPRVRVRTAGGDVMAADITLDSVVIGGWEVPNVRVLVHDLPGNESIGLLGINFLGKFRMDLRTDEGVLILEPR